MYILNKYLRGHKPLSKELEVIYGIGRLKAEEVCSRCGLSGEIKVKSLSRDDQRALILAVEDLSFVDTNLRRYRRERINRLVLMKSYRGRRHTQNLPCRGQRTHRNAQTRKRMNWKTLH